MLYLCIIIILKNMKEMIMLRGFQNTECHNEFVRGNWTIRLDDDLIEVFNNPDKGKKGEGFYYIDSLEELNLNDLLDDIDDIDRNLL